MIRNILISFALLCSFACGSADDEGLFDDQGDELGQVEQDLSAKTSPTYQYGTQTGSSHSRCNKTLSGQVCSVPTTKAQVVCFRKSPAFTANEQTDILAQMSALAARTGWSFNTAVEDPFTGLCTTSAQTISINRTASSCGASGTGSNNITAYGCISGFGSTSTLTEGSGVVGQYQKHGTCTINLDADDIAAKGTSSANDRRIFRHAVMHSLLGCVGIGGNSGTVTGRASRETIAESIEQTSLTSGESCSMDSYSTSSPTAYSNATPACSND